MTERTLESRQLEVRESLIRALKADLVGPMKDDEVLPSAPSRWYLTGFLVPTAAPEEHRVDPLADEALENEVHLDAADGAADDVRPPRPFLPSSMGMSFLVPADVDELNVTVTWGDYLELTDEETREWKERERAGSRGGRTVPAPQEQVEGEEEEPESLRFRYWRRWRTFVAEVPVPLRVGKPIQVPGGNGVKLRAVVRSVQVGTQRGSKAVSLFLVNERVPAEKGATNADQRSIFDVQLEVFCQPGFVSRHRVATTEHPDDLRNDLQFRSHCEWAVGHNVATEAVLAGGTCRAVRSTWLPRASVYRMKARPAGVSLAMDDLAELTSAQELREWMDPLLDDYQAWIDGQKGKLPDLDAQRRATAESLLVEAGIALRRMSEGIDVLANPDALSAFRFANAAMAEAARKARPDVPKPEWRLFQLAFVLLNLAGATEPTHEDRERVDLLFFPTGGGKTEAYLGVAAFVLVLRRLRGRDRPDEGAGVAVLLRYTLRLLTLDQLRRAAQLICALEVLRRAQPGVLGSKRFSIGLWVGRSASANHLKDVIKPMRQLKSSGSVRGGPPPVPLTRCPWCDAELTSDSFHLVPNQKSAKALVVGCPNIECEFGFNVDPSLPAHQDGLPIVVVDEQVYRELPSIVVGTVDKFASLPWRGAVGMLFGRVKAEGEYGFLGEHERVPGDARPLPDGLRPPALIIQDELHLISGPLGTMVGLYETAIDALCRDRVGYGPKVIASTATARRASEQIQALFARPVTHLFPPQGLDDGETYFAEPDTLAEKARVYVGVAAPGRSVKVLAARTYTALLGAAQKAWEEGGPPGLKNPADTYMTLACYFNALKELGGAQRLVQEDVAGRTEQLDRRRPLNHPAGELFAERRLSFDVQELTSRQDTDEVARAIARLKLPFGKAMKDKTDVLLASSMISVGVDIGRLGLMVVNGQPKTTAEYIQASSRVGRETPGLVVTALNLYKPRDRSHYERFQAYHESFYREVEAASVTPFSARAVDRGLAGLVVGLARHLGPRMAPSEAVVRIGKPGADELEQRIIELLTARALAHRDGVPKAVADSLKERVANLVIHWKELVEQVQEAGQPMKYSPWETPKNYPALLSTAVDEHVGEFAEDFARFTAPTSMRDVEPGIHVWVDIKRAKRGGERS